MKKIKIILFFFILFFSGFKTYSFSDNNFFEFLNRRIYSFNRGIDSVLLDKASTIYINIMPKYFKKNFGFFFDNMSEIQNCFNGLILNNVNYFKISFSRFIINSTFGLCGFFDLASSVNIPPNKLEFRDILINFGYNNSSYIFLPVIGPGTLRDDIGLFVTQLFTLQFYFIDKLSIYYFFEIINKKSQILFDSNFFDKNMLDGYSFLKDVFLQNINYKDNKLDNDFLSEPPE